MTSKLFTDKFLAKLKSSKLNEKNISLPELLGFKKTKIVFYPFITGRGLKDIRTVFKQSLEEDFKLIDFYGKLIKENMTLMQRALIIAKKINSRILYQSDISNYKRAEYWASPIEIHNKQIDDCDGYAVLLCYVLRLLGAKDYEVFVRAGYVSGQIGHATTVIFDINTCFYYPLEGSFYASRSLKEFGKIPIHLNKRYLKAWWITNDKLSFSKMPLLRFVR